MKKITQEQITSVLNAFENLNISHKDYLTLAKFFEGLPAIEVEGENK